MMKAVRRHGVHMYWVLRFSLQRPLHARDALEVRPVALRYGFGPINIPILCFATLHENLRRPFRAAVEKAIMGNALRSQTRSCAFHRLVTSAVLQLAQKRVPCDGIAPRGDDHQSMGDRE